MQLKDPLDKTPYPKDPESRPITGPLPDESYAYVRDTLGIVHVMPDGPHVHPKILGGGQPAMYAGDMTVRHGRVADLTNLSGTFQFDDEAGLLEVATALVQQGLKFEPGAVRFFPADGSAPITLA
jgi:hypothetical protein